MLQVNSNCTFYIFCAPSLDSDSVGQLSSDDHSSGLEEEEQSCPVPQESLTAKTPDQEKFLKHNFEALANEFSRGNKLYKMWLCYST